MVWEAMDVKAEIEKSVIPTPSSKNHGTIAEWNTGYLANL